MTIKKARTDTMENFPSSKKGYESGKADNPQTATQQEAEAARYKQPDRQ